MPATMILGGKLVAAGETVKGMTAAGVANGTGIGTRRAVIPIKRTSKIHPHVPV